MKIDELMKYMYAVVIGLILAVQLANQVSSKRDFSTNLDTLLKLRVYNNVSISMCEEQCERRWRCHGAVYRRDVGLCTLMMNHPDGPVHEVKIADRSTVLLTGFKHNADVCEGSTCGYRETCNDTGECSVQECGQPPRFYHDYDGNMYGLENRIRLRDTNLTLRCNETGGWIPETNYPMFDCESFSAPSGVHTQADSYYKIYCDMETDGGKWLVFQRRQNGSVNFQRGWNEYELGFGDLSGEFWLGLQLLHDILTSGQYELRIDLEDYNGTQRYATYSTFRMTGPDENYRIELSDYSGNAGDAMNNTYGMMFSTFDRDNDFSSDNCATRYHGAWWYTDCYEANLNGKYFDGPQNTTENGTHIHWNTWPEVRDWYSLRRTEMKVRRKPASWFRTYRTGGGRQRRRRRRS